MFAILNQAKLVDRWTNDYYLDDNNVLRSRSGRKITFGEKHFFISGILISILLAAILFISASGPAWLFLSLLLPIGFMLVSNVLSMTIAYPSLHYDVKWNNKYFEEYQDKLDAIVKNVKPGRYELIRNGKSYRHVTVAYPSVARPMDNWVQKVYDLQEAGANVLPAKDLAFIKKSIDSGWDLISNYDALPLENKQGDSQESELVVKKLNELVASYEFYLKRANELRREKFEASASAVDKLVGSSSVPDEV